MEITKQQILLDIRMILADLVGKAETDLPELFMNIKILYKFDDLDFTEFQMQIENKYGFYFINEEDDKFAKLETFFELIDFLYDKINHIKSPGTILFTELLKRKNEINEDNMSVIKLINKNNNYGFTTYFRYDAVIKFCNENFLLKNK